MRFFFLICKIKHNMLKFNRQDSGLAKVFLQHFKCGSVLKDASLISFFLFIFSPFPSDHQRLNCSGREREGRKSPEGGVAVWGEALPKFIDLGLIDPVDKSHFYIYIYIKLHILV